MWKYLQPPPALLEEKGEKIVESRKKKKRGKKTESFERERERERERREERRERRKRERERNIRLWILEEKKSRRTEAFGIEIRRLRRGEVEERGFRFLNLETAGFDYLIWF